MNVITVLIDSLNFHSIEPYGATHVQTPNLQRFAQRASVFDNHFISSAPCMPARRELFTGRQEFLWRSWGHIEPWDRQLAAEAGATGATTQMITDHYHYWENNAHGYFESFHGVEFVRGLEIDMWKTPPLAEVPEWASAIDRGRRYNSRHYPQGQGTQFYANAREWQHEADFPTAQVMQKSADWLDENHEHDKFLLWVESFDPHEPFYVPEPYRSLYTNGNDDATFNCWPPYQRHDDAVRFVEGASPAELDWIRAQYYGNVTMVDAWLGKLWDKLDELNLWETTAVIVTTDHGHDLCYNYPNNPTIWGKSFPHPESHARIPLMIWHPEFPGNGQRINALTNALDVNATIRDLMDVPQPSGPHGRSLLPLLRGETTGHREYLLYGIFGDGVVLSTADWTLTQSSVEKGPLYWYSTTATRATADMTSGHFIPGVEIPQWRVPATPRVHPNYLWNRDAFTLTPENHYATEPQRVSEMQDLLRQALDDCAAPPETMARLGLA